MFLYKCPECETKVKSPSQANPGQKFTCPECQATFTPVAGNTLKFADDPPKPAQAKARPAAAAAKPAAAKAAPAKATAKPGAPAPTPAAPAAAAKPPDDDAEDNNPYGVVKETEEELKLAQKNKPIIGSIRDKFKRSARGPASALLVLPSNLLIGQGALTVLAGIGLMVIGAWPLVFTDVPNSDEEYAEQMFLVFGGLFSCIWGGIQCYGASQMQNLESYPWGIVAAIFGFLPLLAGIFAIITLNDPRVIAGFTEPLAGPNAVEEEEKKEDDDDEEDEDDEEEEEEDERPRKRKRR